MTHLSVLCAAFMQRNKARESDHVRVFWLCNSLVPFTPESALPITDCVVVVIDNDTYYTHTYSISVALMRKWWQRLRREMIYRRAINNVDRNIGNHRISYSCPFNPFGRINDDHDMPGVDVLKALLHAGILPRD